MIPLNDFRTGCPILLLHQRNDLPQRKLKQKFQKYVYAQWNNTPSFNQDVFALGVNNLKDEHQRAVFGIRLVYCKHLNKLEHEREESSFSLSVKTHRKHLPSGPSAL